MLSILRKARLKDKELRILMLYDAHNFIALDDALANLDAAASIMRAKPRLSNR